MGVNYKVNSLKNGEEKLCLKCPVAKQPGRMRLEASPFLLLLPELANVLAEQCVARGQHPQ